MSWSKIDTGYWTTLVLVKEGRNARSQGKTTMVNANQ